jgi:hypothetical protein
VSGYDATLSDGVTTVGIKLDFIQGKGGGSSASGTWTLQNSTPSDAQFKNSEPGFADTSPYSARTYSAQNGSIGKLTEVEAPADLARPFACDLDNTRPGVIAPRLQFPYNSGLVTFPATPGGSTRITSAAFIPVSSITNGDGVVVQTSGGTDAGVWWYSYNPSTHQYQATKRLVLNTGMLPYYSGSSGLRIGTSVPTLAETSGHLWVSMTTGGAIDALAAYPQTAVQTGTYFAYFVPFAGMTFAFDWGSYSGPGINISLRDSATLAVLTPATLAGTPAPELGNNPITVPVENVAYIHPPCVFNGAIYFASDREVFKVVWDDNAMKIVAVPIHTSFTRITAGPVIFQGSIYIGSGNTLWKWTPGQTEWTSQPVDSFGVLPQDKGGGTIVSMRPVAGGLLLAALSDPSIGADATLLMVDAQGVISMVDSVTAAPTGVVRSGQDQRLVVFVDASSASFSPIVGVVTRGSGSLRVVPLLESSRDPAYLPAGSRPQVAGSHFWTSPFDPAENYGDRKQLLKVAAQVADVTATCKVRVYYQTDHEYLLADDLDASGGGLGSPAGTILSGQGKWHLAFTLTNGTAGLTNTSGSAWAGYAEQSLVAKNLTYRQIRWCVEIIGDTTGTVYPRISGLKAFYSETPAMYVVHSLRARILAEDPDLKRGITPAPPTDAAGVYAIYSQIFTWLKSGTFLTFLDANGDSRVGKLTKMVFNGVDLIDNVDATPTIGRRRLRKIILTLALQEADSAA